MTEHAVIAGGGPTGLMLAAGLALAGIDVAVVERRANQDLPRHARRRSSRAHDRGPRSVRSRGSVPLRRTSGPGRGIRRGHAGHQRLAAELSGLGIHYELGGGHPLLGRRMPDLDLVTATGTVRVFTLLHEDRPVLLNLGEACAFRHHTWADRVQLIDATYDGVWELPALGAVSAPGAVLIRPDGHVAWVGDRTRLGLADALTTWFGPPAAA